ncbi:CAP domain-containing protein [Haloferula chungangensis]|uniref:CAP domain-containing protein n=1 Tax=Haloferula chungangensis TaxID=1048331 RepID=A0ABW2L5C4_9BACT
MKALWVLLFLISSLQAQVSGPAAEFSRKANQWMASTDASKRQAAYRTWLQMGPEAMPEYEKSLEASRKFHDQAIDKLGQGTAAIQNPYSEHADLASEIDEERKRILPLIRTDWKKDGSRIKELRENMEKLARINERLARLTKVDTRAFDEALESHFAALLEITRQLERFDEEANSIGRSDDEILGEITRLHVEGSHLRAQQERFKKSREAVELLAATNEQNKKMGPWASGSMINFAELLNAERNLLGLRPLVLEEKLSAAAEGHSGDMVRVGFFAHESPVPGKKSPRDRAKLAGFTGSLSGENIYMGSASAQAAYDAWFASDGHRFIMMASGPKLLGVGIAGNHWTMMTGKP